MSLNLLPNQAKFRIDEMRSVTLSKKFLKIFLFVWVILVSIVFALLQGEMWWLSKKNEQYKVVSDSYLQSANEIVISQMIKFRAKLLGKVLTERFEYADAFGVVGKIFDSKIKIKDFELKEKSFFLMNVVAPDNESMKLVESRVNEINSGVEPNIKKVVIKSTNYSKSLGEWLVSLEVYLI